MANSTSTTQANLSNEEVITRAVQFFTSSRWKATTQSARSATFEGKPPIPWALLFLTIIGLFFFIIPGVIMYLFLIKKMYGFQSLVVTANPTANGTEVVITYPKHAKNAVNRFLKALPAT